MSIVQVLQLVGFPSIISMILGVVIAKVKQTSEEAKALEGGVKALLRDRMLMSFHYCQRQGKRSELDTSNFLSMYKEYKALKGNSFIDDVKENFMDIELEVK